MFNDVELFHFDRIHYVEHARKFLLRTRKEMNVLMSCDLAECSDFDPEDMCCEISSGSNLGHVFEPKLHSYGETL